MTPAEIIHGAAEDGIQLILSSNGAIKVSGDAVAVSQWTPLIREKKTGILSLLARPESRSDLEESNAILEQLRQFRFDLIEQ